MPSKEFVFREEYRGPLVNDCSSYFRKIAERLQISVPQVTADGLIDHISASWVKIGKGGEDGPKAQGLAKQGYLVVALLKAKEHYPFHPNPKTHKYDEGKVPHPYHHGHLAIVLPTSTTDYPYVICGSTAAGKSDGSKKVYEKGANSPWREIDAPNVQYYRTPKMVPDPVR
jgi:hypothetical protein